MNDDELARLWAVEQRILGLTQAVAAVLAETQSGRGDVASDVLRAVERCEAELLRSPGTDIQVEAARLLRYEIGRRSAKPRRPGPRKA